MALTLLGAMATVHRRALNDLRYAEYEAFSKAFGNAVAESLKPGGNDRGATICAAYLLGVFDQNERDTVQVLRAYWGEHARPGKQPTLPLGGSEKEAE